MQVIDSKRDVQWRHIMEEVKDRVAKLSMGYDDSQDLEGWLLEKLLLLEQRFPERGILHTDKVHLRLWFMNLRIKDWIKSRSLRKAHHVPIVQRNIDSGDEYELDQETNDAELLGDEQYKAIESRDEAEVADREIRKLIGKRGAKLLDVVKSMDTLDSAEIAEKLECLRGAVNSQFHLIRQQSKKLKIRALD